MPGRTLLLGAPHSGARAPWPHRCANSRLDSDMGSGKISSSPFSTPVKMARATDSGEPFGMSRPRDISVSTGPVRTTACTLTVRPKERATIVAARRENGRQGSLLASLAYPPKSSLDERVPLCNAEVSNFLCFLFVSPTTVRDQPGGIVLSGPERGVVLSRPELKGHRFTGPLCWEGGQTVTVDPQTLLVAGLIAFMFLIRTISGG
jgi:hypothetical protein